MRDDRADLVIVADGMDRPFEVEGEDLFDVTSVRVVIPCDDALRVWMAIGTTQEGRRPFPSGEWLHVASRYDDVPDASPTWSTVEAFVGPDGVSLTVSERDAVNETVGVLVTHAELEDHLVAQGMVPESERHVPTLLVLSTAPRPF